MSIANTMGTEQTFMFMMNIQKKLIYDKPGRNISGSYYIPMAWKHNMKHELQGSQGKAVVANFKETYK